MTDETSIESNDSEPEGVQQVSDSIDAPAGPDSKGSGATAASRASRLWRSIWRTHFYAGVVAGPILLLLAVTGLIILYTDPIQGALDGDVRTVHVGTSQVSLDSQRAAVAKTYPKLMVMSVTPPKSDDRSTQFSVHDADDVYSTVFVNQYTGKVLGLRNDGDDVVGLANRLHGFLNNDSITVPVPTLNGIFGDADSVFEDMKVGDLLLEVFAGWGLILAVTGLYLWWPRKAGTGKALFVPRLRKPGRARWRDLHAVSGTVLGVMLLFFVVTGLPWSASWGTNWGYVASKVTPNDKNFYDDDVPISTLAKTGDLDRIGNRIPWATRENPVPDSTTSGDSGMEAMPGMPATGSSKGTATGAVPATVSLDLVKRAADEEGMLRGYAITLPADNLEDPQKPQFGSFVVFNPWPSDIGNQAALYVDQFSAKTIGKSSAASWGALPWATELGVQTHMGTQFGIVSRIVMTTSCVLVIWSFITAFTMWNKRRRKGTVGLPRRPVDVRLQRVMGISALVLAVIYPLWGITLVMVLLFDRYVVRRVPRLRTAFGMR